MANTFAGYVRRIDFEPKKDYLEYRTYAHVFLKSQDEKIDVYTDNPRFEAAFLTAYSVQAVQTQPPEKRYIEVHYEVVDKTNKVVRVILDEEFV